ncbi:MAG: hypothetical protein AAF703_08115 [Cyanobacteria bacterium P01_D01_bin.105]
MVVSLQKHLQTLRQTLTQKLAQKSYLRSKQPLTKEKIQWFFGLPFAAQSYRTDAITSSQLTKPDPDSQTSKVTHEPVTGDMPSDMALEIKGQALDADIAADIEADIRATRKFSLADAIGKEGGGFLRSGSTIPRPLQATNVIDHFIQTHTREPTSALATTLQQWSHHDIRLSQRLDAPLSALAALVDALLTEPTTFYEFARQIAIAHGQLTGERPHFQQPNHPPHPDADYTHDSIRTELTHLQCQLQSVSR